MNIEPTVSVIIPTYNEVENIKRIVADIHATISKERISFEIIVVDDDSPDGTADVTQALSEQYPVRVHIRRKEKGLATAVMRGFELSRGEICLVMDADLSHPVEKIPEMIKPILMGHCDATVGSRYMAGGGLKEWPFMRRIVSRGAGFLASGLVTISDPTSGFMAVRRKLLEDKCFDPVGWKIVLEVLVKTNCRVSEVPIVFNDREKGVSKLNVMVQGSYLLHLWKLYCHKYRRLFEFVKFAVVGVSGLVIDTSVLVTLVEAGAFDPRVAAIFSFAVAASSNYFLNSSWTFNCSNELKILRSYFAFVFICLMGLAVRIGIMHLLIQYGGMGGGLWYILSSVIGILAGTIFNFMGSKYLVFPHTLLTKRS